MEEAPEEEEEQQIEAPPPPKKKRVSLAGKLIKPAPAALAFVTAKSEPAKRRGSLAGKAPAGGGEKEKTVKSKGGAVEVAVEVLAEMAEGDEEKADEGMDTPVRKRRRGSLAGKEKKEVKGAKKVRRDEEDEEEVPVAKKKRAVVRKKKGVEDMYVSFPFLHQSSCH